ncbi:HAD hydrolase-like protein [Actinosynnema sp. NPDC047251]|uniref:Haloacid dehalogenase domain protein hydrolase n=1 Tax=Saccharothrix espanaensis (strain ATCC 51144 / DSM 44229 / JCM 9112 / NBRC 15066 / NRRL 15764) TaxID=1179773 RepID=K0K0D8_SACES|nr:HAD hydrolase-like protein [Saccharothrix espanaensis]CCH31801.1 hypothetical protein BN6_45210 [Saccharothrix espanaensis DSM 44229]
MGAEKLLAERDHVLVSFDGPIVGLPAAQGFADRLRVLIEDGGLPREVARTDDLYVVLAHAATIGPATARAVYAHLCRMEHELVAVARLVPGVREALAALVAAGTQITVVTALDAEVVRAFLVLHGLAEHVRHVVGRAGPDPAVLPPAPDLITLAVRERAFPAGSCGFVGGTRADLTAARAAGIEAVHLHRAPPQTPEASWFDALSAPTKS